MKLTATTLAALVAGSAAMAHDGAHAHPHGSETAVIAMLAIIAIGAVLLKRRR